VVTTFHNLQKPRGWTHGREPLEWLLETSERWITTNELDRREMAEIPGADRKLRLVPTGSNIDAPGRHGPIGEATQPLRLVYFGFLNPVKGIEMLLQAVAQVRQRDVPVHLEMAAGIHTDATSRLRDYAAFIHKEIERLALGACIEQRGFLAEAELSQLLLRSDLAVFPFRDGLSNKNCSFWTTLEHGTPALTTRGDGLPEGLVHGDNVLLSPVDDADALADRLQWAHENRDALRRLGGAGQQYVRQRLDWARLTRDMLTIFAETFREVSR
jgi:glycosyltransferase involved in cell wall biosynthesis